jgi:hypothetical protein
VSRRFRGGQHRFHLEQLHRCPAAH